MSELVQSLRKELAKLEAELLALAKDDPRYGTMIRIRELLADYEKKMPEPEPQPRSRVEPETPAGSSNGSWKTKATIMEESIKELLQRNRLMHRSAILDHLRSRGIMGHEKNPMNDLAAFLSGHRDLFVSDGRGNFRLQEPQ
jgi:hypothetical protein